jgi:hypothetical protein
MIQKQLLLPLKVLLIEFMFECITGRLLQVEYAIESINKMEPTVGLLTKEGIIIGAKKPTISKLLEQGRLTQLSPNSNSKSYPISISF